MLKSIRQNGKPVSTNQSESLSNSFKANMQIIDYNALDTLRREIIRQEEVDHKIWKSKFEPWLINEYQEMYDNMSRNRRKQIDNRAISLKRPEWQQPTNVLPPIQKRLSGQRRRRVLGSFPETENDKIGWRLLPEHAIDKYGSKAANIPPLPKQYKFSSWPIESFS